MFKADKVNRFWKSVLNSTKRTCHCTHFASYDWQWWMSAKVTSIFLYRQTSTRIVTCLLRVNINVTEQIDNTIQNTQEESPRTCIPELKWWNVCFKMLIQAFGELYDWLTFPACKFLHCIFIVNLYVSLHWDQRKREYH